jgi:oligo-1,6-glucosidase
MTSTVADVWANPTGRDAIEKLLLTLGRSTAWVTNPAVARLRLSQLARMAGRRVPQTFFDALLRLLNGAPEQYVDPGAPPQRAWWKEAVFYQIYPRSFKDSNGDGIGDLGGIIDSLDHLQGLGIDALWLSPIYDSPNDDNGYDIRDYRAIMAEFGTMDDFDRLLSQVHERGMRLIMDLVVNHTSDEHPWFTAALDDPASQFRDYYFFRPGRGATGEQPPNNWTSFFSGPAWRRFRPAPTDGATDGAGAASDWGLHLFSAKQMDLNWDNPAVRDDVADMVRWWLAKGVDGFRLDVINYISKQPALPDGDLVIGELMGFVGVENYVVGPHLHEYLRELRAKAFEPFGAVSVGETPGIGMSQAALLTADYRRELDMIFSFDHLENPGRTRFDDYRYDLDYLKEYLIRWAQEFPANCQPSFFYDNHDNPRFVSKVNPAPEHRVAIAKALATIQLTSRGTPFLYQGQEIGMVNQRFASIDQLRDLESLNLYQDLLATMSPQAAFARVLAGTRDHARVPVQWTAGPHGGFSSGGFSPGGISPGGGDVRPWLEGDGDHERCNVADQSRDDGSVLNFYRRLIALRRSCPALVYGDVRFVEPARRGYFGYLRTLGDAAFFIECNLTDHPIRCARSAARRAMVLTPALQSQGSQRSQGSQGPGRPEGPEGVAESHLRPYQAAIYRVSPSVTT